jgi:2-C-methyl-D-erythritol 4-phosphate cytidylyltransferase/2-C-methyl-D-erythritol 2,4-cyclodiphosphate synthase
MEAGGRTAALLVAAGSGSRAGGDRPKQFRPIGGRPLLAHALAGLRHPRIDLVQVVIGDGQQAAYREAVGDAGLPLPVTGGATRQHSVRNGLEALARDGDVGRVLIHDAARPFLPPAVVDRLLDALDAHDAAVPVLPVVDTLARRRQGLGESVSRHDLVRVQTPQAFRFAAIALAHAGWTGGEATDDAQVARAAGIAVATVDGDPMLEKLTFESDFERAGLWLGSRPVPRTGFGFDVHAFAPGDGLWLGGVRIPHQRGLAGHSDADVLLHAITDALLGAIGAGDIGDHFPPGDPQWRGAASSLFVERARALVEQGGGRIVHVDATLICEAPRIGPYRQAMRERIAALLRLPAARVSIKATTTERLGFAGRGEGVAAQAVATVALPDDYGSEPS